MTNETNPTVITAQDPKGSNKPSEARNPDDKSTAKPDQAPTPAPTETK